MIQSSKAPVLTPAVAKSQLQDPIATVKSRLASVTSSLESIVDFAAILESPAYKSLSAAYSHARTNYNSLTQVLIIQCTATSIHDSPQTFVSRAILCSPHLQSLYRILSIASGTEHLCFSGPYKRSQKEPDVFVNVAGFYWPSLIVETGWSETYSDLLEDAKLWLLGSRGRLSADIKQPDDVENQLDFTQPVNAVILIFFERQNFETDPSSLEGYFEVWRCDPANANVIKRCLSTKFYPNPPADSAIVEFTLQEIVRATNVPPGVSGTTAIEFDLTYLAELVKGSVGKFIYNLGEKRRINTEKWKEQENVTMISERDKEQQIEDQTKVRDERATSRAGRDGGASN